MPNVLQDMVNRIVSGWQRFIILHFFLPVIVFVPQVFRKTANPRYSRFAVLFSRVNSAIPGCLPCLILSHCHYMAAGF